jgi:hypothetical protein
MAQGKWTSKTHVAESIIVEKCTNSSTWAGSAARCLIIYIYIYICHLLSAVKIIIFYN